MPGLTRRISGSHSFFIYQKLIHILKIRNFFILDRKRMKKRRKVIGKSEILYM